MFARCKKTSVVACALGTLLVACNKNAGKLVDTAGTSPQNTSVQAQRITGRAYLIAPIANAHVTVTRLASGTPDEPIAETMTNEAGEFDVTLPLSTDGDLLIQVVGDRGGSTLEPVTGIAPITLSENDRVATLAVNTHLGDETNVVVNPLSTLVTARSVAEYRSGRRLSDTFAKNVDLFSAHFKTASPWLSLPVDLTAGEAPGLSSGVISGLALIGLSQHALELGARAGVSDVSIVNTLVILRLLVADLQDGVFDGRSGVTPLKVSGNVFIDSETTRLSLGKAIDTWLDSPANKTGLTKRDVSHITAAIRDDLSELYPASETPPQEVPETQQSGAPPAITITSPQAGQTLGKTDLISGHIDDADGVSSFTILLDGTRVLIPIDTSVPTKWTFSFPPDIETGSHVLQVAALDSKGNQSSKQVNFSFDETAPSISLVQCAAPDDRARVASVTIAGATYAATTNMSPCTEGSLSDGSQAFFTYADLYDEGTERAPLITLSTTDTALESVTYVVKVNDAVVQTERELPAAVGPATHIITVSSAFLGLAATSAHAADGISVEVTAKDTLGNSSTRIFRFHLTLIPAPLYVQEQPADAAVGLTTHTFAANNVQELFHQNFFYPLSSSPCGQYWCQAFPESLIHVTKFFVMNVSPRPITMPFDWASATTGSLSLSRSAFRTFFSMGDAYALGSNPCPEMTEVDSWEYPQSGSGPNYATQSCISIGGQFKRGKNTESLLFDPLVAVYELPSNTRVTTSPLTLQPGKQYAVVIALYNMRTPTYPTQSVNTQYPPRDLGYSIGSSYLAQYGAYPYLYSGAPTQIADENYFGGVHGILWNSASSLHSFFRAYIGFDRWYPPYGSTETPRMHLIRSGNSNFKFYPVVFEHSVTLSGDVKWRAPSAMSAEDPVFVGTGNHQPVAALSSFNTTMAKPNLCPFTNPMCNSDLSGW